MAALLDHLILHVNDAKATAEFFERVLGFSCDGQQGPFTVVRIMHTGEMMIFATGCYEDRVALGGEPRFTEKTVILDSRAVDTLLAIPL